MSQLHLIDMVSYLHLITHHPARTRHSHNVGLLIFPRISDARMEGFSLLSPLPWNFEFSYCLQKLALHFRVILKLTLLKKLLLVLVVFEQNFTSLESPVHYTVSDGLLLQARSACSPIKQYCVCI